MGLLDYDIELAKNKLRSLLDAAPEYVNQLTQNVRNITGQNNAANLFAMRNLDAMAGGDITQNVRQNIQEGRDKGMEMALNFNPGAVGMFIGKGAKTWDAAAAAEAEKRLAAGDDARKVWSELGVFRGPDGHLRQEIPDNNIPQKLRLDEKQLLSYPEMKDSLPHKQLYQAYPDTANIRLAPVLGDELGHLDSSQNVIGLKPISAGDFTPAASQQKTSTQIHELQHAIQQREGWAKGGSPEQMAKEIGKRDELRDKVKYAIEQAGSASDPVAKNNWYQQAAFYGKQVPPELNNLHPEEAYLRLAGEAEARATQARMNMDMAQRRATFPLDSYDVPVNQLIIRGLLGE